MSSHRLASRPPLPESISSKPVTVLYCPVLSHIWVPAHCCSISCCYPFWCADVLMVLSSAITMLRGSLKGHCSTHPVMCNPAIFKVLHVGYFTPLGCPPTSKEQYLTTTRVKLFTVINHTIFFSQKRLHDLELFFQSHGYHTINLLYIKKCKW